MAPPYFVRAQDGVVETWAIKRLPYEAKGWAAYSVEALPAG